MRLVDRVVDAVSGSPREAARSTFSFGKSLTKWSMVTLLMSFGNAFAQQPPAIAPNTLDVIPDAMPFDIPYGPPISLQRAQSLLAAGVAEAQKRGWKMNLAVTDSGGSLVAFARMDGALLASIPIAEHKARNAVTFRRDTGLVEGAVQNGVLYILTLDGVIASRGGLPLIEDGKIIGGLGSSGGAGSQDELIAKAAVAALK